MTADCQANCWSLELQWNTNWVCVALFWEGKDWSVCVCWGGTKTILWVQMAWPTILNITHLTHTHSHKHTWYWPIGITRRGGTGRRNKVGMWTPRMHCQTRTIDQVGVNQPAAAEEVDHFSPFIISVSLMLPGKKRWREDRHLYKGWKSITLTEMREREVERKRKRGKPTPMKCTICTTIFTILLMLDTSPLLSLINFSW